MTILEKGRFCESCNKTVIDFTNKTREEIIQKINGKNEVCGRFYITQLKEINFKKRKNDFYLAKWAMLLGLGSVLGISEPAISKTPKPTIELRENSKWKSILPQKKEKDSIIIKGKILDKFPLPGVNVTFKGTSIATQTDFNGEFSLTIPTNKLNEENYLVFSYVGYKTKKYRFNKKTKYLKINLVPAENINPITITIMGAIARDCKPKKDK